MSQRGVKVQPVTVDLCFERPLSASSGKACHSVADGRIRPPSILIPSYSVLFHPIPLISSESSQPVRKLRNAMAPLLKRRAALHKFLTTPGQGQ